MRFQTFANTMTRMEHIEIAKKYTLPLGIVISIGVLLAYVGYRNLYAPIGQETDMASTTGIVVDLAATSTPGYTIEIVPDDEVKLPPAPSLDRAIPSASASVSAEVRAAVIAKLQDAVAALRANPGSFSAWIDLGVQRKILGDYEGASEAWGYAGALGPHSSIPFENLGDLYANYLKNPTKAIQYYKTAILNSPTAVSAYRNLFELYKSTGSTVSAIQILKDGIARNPKAIDLQVLLARYYRDTGRTSDAKAAYDVAIAAARAANQTTVVSDLEAEKAAL